MMKKLIAAVIASSVGSAVFAFDVPTPEQAAEDLLTGDARTACEALLCLSTNTRPHECIPPVQRYFAIKHKYWSDTVSARRDFLNLCPTAKDEKADMPSLVNAIANGAGRCDADYLNRRNRSYKIEKEQICNRFGCYLVQKRVEYIKPNVPNYCKVYSDHNYTHNVAVKYIDGRFVNVK